MEKTDDIFKPVIDLDAGITKEEQDEPLDKAIDIHDIVGLFRTYSVVPTGVPKKFVEQVQLVVTGGAASLYFYDTSNNYWRTINVTSG